MSSSKRNALILAAVAAVSGYLFFRAESFWGVVCSIVIVAWALIGALPVMDGLWRLKTGFVFSTFLFAIVALTPTVAPLVDGWTHGKFSSNGLVAYAKNNIGFGIAPGLDLRGGVRLVYTVEVEEAIADRRNNSAEEMRQELATIFKVHEGEGRITRDEMIKLDDIVHVSTPESAIIRLKFKKDPNDRAKVDERFLQKFQKELSTSMGPGADEITFKMRSEIESAIREKAVSQAKDTMSKRIDEKGLREASLTTRDEDIIVEVPGLDKKTFDEIKEIISRTARLEFKMVDDPTDFFGKIKDDELPEGEGIAIYKEQAPDGIGTDGKAKSTTTSYARMALRDGEKMDAARERFKAWVRTLNVPDDHQVGFEQVVRFDPDTGTSTEEGWRTLYLFKRAEVTGDYITDAQVSQDTQSAVGSYYVALTFSPTGADRFEEVTGANVQRRFAIILDDVVDSAPVIKTKIGGGRASITMGAGDVEKQLQDARKLELVLRSGALPAQITPSNSSEIGPSLGRDSIDQAVKGLMVSGGLVLAFMIFYYRKAGLVADGAVLFNLMLQMAILASFSATMTLPGIAGLALTIGMGVDANVLINERIREELRAGRSVRAAVEAGYGKAFSSILDGHVTVFISGLILAQYGTGPVKGFAFTLIVGIIASLFTGVFCTRLVFDWWTRGAKVKTLSVGAEF
jgi:preprotein translocase subunit SecD